MVVTVKSSLVVTVKSSLKMEFATILALPWPQGTGHVLRFHFPAVAQTEPLPSPVWTHGNGYVHMMGMGGMKGVFSFETCTGWRALHLRGIWCILGSKRTNYRGPTTLRDARRRTKRRISYPRTPPERWHHSSVVAELFGTMDPYQKGVASMKMTTKLPSIRGWRLVEAHWWWQHKPGIDGKGS